jgi:hypothetical protein
MIYVAKISYKDSGGTGQTAYFTNGQGWRTRSSDTPASTWIESRLVDPGSVRRSMFRDAAAFGPIESGYGAAVLLNTDGGLDAWRAYFVAGNDYEVFALTEPGEASGTWTSVVKLGMRFVQIDQQRMDVYVIKQISYLLVYKNKIQKF